MVYGSDHFRNKGKHWDEMRGRQCVGAKRGEEGGVLKQKRKRAKLNTKKVIKTIAVNLPFPSQGLPRVPEDRRPEFKLASFETIHWVQS